MTTAATKPHILFTKETCPCDKQSDAPCLICDGGLAVCSVCHKAETELDGPCAAPASTPGEAAQTCPKCGSTEPSIRLNPKTHMTQNRMAGWQNEPEVCDSGFHRCTFPAEATTEVEAPQMVDGRPVIPCPDGKPGCEVLHLGPLPVPRDPANLLADNLERAGFQNVVADGPVVSFYFHNQQYEVRCDAPPPAKPALQMGWTIDEREKHRQPAPEGASATRLDAYLTRDNQIVVLGTPPDEPEGLTEEEFAVWYETAHNCDAMGCGSSHVLYRFNLATRVSPSATPPNPPKLPGHDTDWDAYEVEQTERQFKSYQALGVNLTTLQTAAADVAHWNRQYREATWESAREIIATHRAAAPSATPDPAVARTRKMPLSDVKPALNVAWLKENRVRYAGQWVAIRNGEFIDSDCSIQALSSRIGKTKGTAILVTPVYATDAELHTAAPSATGDWEAQEEHPHVSRNPGIYGGAFIVGGVRFKVTNLLAQLYLGKSIADIATIWSLTNEQVKDAIAFAQDFIEEHDDRGVSPSDAETALTGHASNCAVNCGRVGCDCGYAALEAFIWELAESSVSKFTARNSKQPKWFTAHETDGKRVIQEALIALTGRITAALVRRAGQAGLREAAGIAEAMAAGETTATGRQKALNIAAAIRSRLSAVGEEKGEQ